MNMKRKIKKKWKILETVKEPQPKKKINLFAK